MKKYEESEKVELKKSLSQLDKGLKAVCAFLNHKGGKVYFGVADNGKVIGLQVSDRSLRKVSQHIHFRIKPEIAPEVRQVESVIEVKIKEGNNKPYFLNGIAYLRVGTENQIIPPDDLKQLIIEQKKTKWDEEICEGACLDDIEKSKVKWYLKQRDSTRNISKDIKISVNQLMRNIKALDKSKPTNAGILFFGKSPQKFFPNAYLRVVRFKGTKVIHPTLDTVNCVGSICEMINTAEDFIRKNIRLLGTRTNKSFQREDKFEYPIKGLREGIINALIHRDYLETGDVRIFIFDDRIEIINPGHFPKGVTPRNPKHKPVNEVICNLVYDVGFT